MLLMQVADWLLAPTYPLACHFCRKLVHEGQNCDAAWRMLSACDPHIQDAVLSAHPVLADRCRPLSSKLLHLPPCLRAHACHYAMASSSERSTLTLRQVSDANALYNLADALANVPEVQALELQLEGLTQHTQCWPAIQQALRAAPQLQRISITRATLPDQFAPELISMCAALANLTSLALTGCNLSSCAARVLAENLDRLSGLRALMLRSNRMHNTGVAALAKHLCSVPHLTALDLSSTQVGDAGVAVLAAQLCAGHVQLRHLDLGVNNIQADGVAMFAAALADGLSTLTFLSLCALVPL